jgi:hypothetical protein
MLTADDSVNVKNRLIWEDSLPDHLNYNLAGFKMRKRNAIKHTPKLFENYRRRNRFSGYV